MSAGMVNPVSSNVQELLDRAFARLDQGNLDGAAADFDQVLRQNKLEGRAWFGQGRLAHAREAYEEALDAIDRAIDCGYKTVDVFRYRGRCHDKLQIYDEITDDFSRVLEYLPEDGEALYERGNALHNLGIYPEALRDYDRARECGINHAQILFCRAQVLYELEQDDQALTSLSEGLARDHSEWPDAEWCHSLGHFWDGAGKPEIGAEFFREAIRREPDCERHYNCFSGVLETLGLEAEIETIYEQLHKLQLGETEKNMAENQTLIYPLVQEHHGAVPLEELNITFRKWPYRAGADLQRGFDRLEEAGFSVHRFHATKQSSQAPDDFSVVYNRDRRNPVIAAPPQYQEIDIGEEHPVRAVKDGLWLLHRNSTPLTVMLNPDYCEIKIQVAAANGPAGAQVTHDFFQHLEQAITRSECYRGKVLSLEQREMYNGQGLGILVHKLRHGRREEVILPQRTLDLLDRNVIQFVGQRPRMAQYGLATKKGLLFYGPPGTGKTHTLHYLAGSMPGHTTFLITAEQVGNLPEYVTLARLLQPSMIVIEDVDLIARDRADMRSPAEEALLNKLLNEMDGLRPDADIIFILTTNRPEALEEALASRPGRVDQAIEFPLPDAEGRLKLVRLYSQGVPIRDEVINFAVERTDRVSASFIKEMMRRSIQFALIRNEEPLQIDADDIEKTLEELLYTGGSLNRKLLGAVAYDMRRAGFGST